MKCEVVGMGPYAVDEDGVVIMGERAIWRAEDERWEVCGWDGG